MHYSRQFARWRQVAIAILVALATPGPALASVDGAAVELAHQMRERGDPEGEIHLAVAGLHATRGGDSRKVLGHLQAARRLGVARSRIDLVLAGFYRRQARYDAALTTLVRVLVSNPGQPYAQLLLWKTLYEVALRKVEVETDTAPIREQLAASGLHLPEQLDLAADAPVRSSKLAAEGYGALLADRPRFAADLFREAIDALPSNARAHRGLGIALARQHDFGRAAGAYMLYLELNPHAADAEEIDRILMRYWRRERR